MSTVSLTTVNSAGTLEDLTPQQLTIGQVALFFPNQLTYACPISTSVTLYDNDAPPYMFQSTVNFTLSQPIYSTDENDVIEFQVYLGSSASASYTYNLSCSLANLGTMVSAPVYSASPDANGIVTIYVNKWFSLRAPGSTYQFRVVGNLISAGSPSTT